MVARVSAACARANAARHLGFRKDHSGHDAVSFIEEGLGACARKAPDVGSVFGSTPSRRRKKGVGPRCQREETNKRAWLAVGLWPGRSKRVRRVAGGPLGPWRLAQEGRTGRLTCCRLGQKKKRNGPCGQNQCRRGFPFFLFIFQNFESTFSKGI